MAWTMRDNELYSDSTTPPSVTPAPPAPPAQPSGPNALQRLANGARHLATGGLEVIGNTTLDAAWDDYLLSFVDGRRDPGERHISYAEFVKRGGAV